jgi:hypothetical protein
LGAGFDGLMKGATLLDMQTIAELPEYTRRAARLLSDSERQGIVDHLAVFPEAGVLIQGTGGLRKLRWGRRDSGKSGGVRVIYYFHSAQLPLYLLTVFGKGEKANLSRSERNELATLARLLVEAWAARHE